MDRERRRNCSLDEWCSNSCIGHEHALTSLTSLNYNSFSTSSIKFLTLSHLMRQKYPFTAVPGQTDHFLLELTSLSARYSSWSYEQWSCCFSFVWLLLGCHCYNQHFGTNLKKLLPCVSSLSCLWLLSIQSVIYDDNNIIKHQLWTLEQTYQPKELFVRLLVAKEESLILTSR